MEINDKVKKVEVEYSTSWVDRVLLGSLIAVAGTATAFNIYSWFADKDADKPAE